MVLTKGLGAFSFLKASFTINYYHCFFPPPNFVKMQPFASS